MERIKDGIKQFKLRDLVAPFVFLLLLIPSWIFRMINKTKHRTLWLVAEQGEARDNGYYFYKYVREKHPDDYCFYAIKPYSPGYAKVAKLGNVIKWGSLKHWLYYMTANLNISSQKSGNPSPIFWYIIHVRLGFYRNRVFLQHGVIKDDLKFVYYSCTKFKFFVCGAEREYTYVLDKFGYASNSIILSGLPRWDGLKDISKGQQTRAILIMPTWRNWLGGELSSVKSDYFADTSYYEHWNGFLNDKTFVNLLESNNIVAYFYPHINMKSFLDTFTVSSDNIKIVSCDQDIQMFFNKCSLMITDYSSAVFDFAYLGKPIIYYQFDEEEYRHKQHPEGYFSYDKDGFGEIATKKDELIDMVGNYVSSNYKPKSKYKKRMDSFFTLRDKKNSQRVYEAIK